MYTKFERINSFSYTLILRIGFTNQWTTVEKILEVDKSIGLEIGCIKNTKKDM